MQDERTLQLIGEKNFASLQSRLQKLALYFLELHLNHFFQYVDFIGFFYTFYFFILFFML